jgi:DNA segregation ATPase FtsK/SpoIIIE-like protein
MKNYFKIFATLSVMIIYSYVTQSQVLAQRGNVSFQIFYDQLSPYGQWANNSAYGYIWIPDVGPEFSPYSTNGYWVMTDYGWTWVSDYDWGWAPFHYGRWDYDNYYGWFWVPDNEWGPSWVTWRRGNGYYGWAPMRPGISISMSFGNGYNDIDRWNFVRDRDFGRSDLGRYYVNRRDNDVIIRNSTVINNTYVDNNRNVTYITGPRRDDVQKFSGRRISSVAISDFDRPGEKLNNGRLNIYRPQIERNNDADRRPSPARITDVKDVRPPAERSINSRRTDVQQQNRQTRGRRQDQQQLQQKQQEQQQIENRRQDQQQLQQKQQEQQQTETRRQDQQQLQQKQQEQQQLQQKQQEQQQLQQKQQDQQQLQQKQQDQQQLQQKQQDQQQKQQQQQDVSKQEQVKQNASQKERVVKQSGNRRNNNQNTTPPPEKGKRKKKDN